MLLFAMGSFNKQTNKQTNKNIKIHCSIVLCAKPCEKKLPLKPRKELGRDFVYSVPSFGQKVWRPYCHFSGRHHISISGNGLDCPQYFTDSRQLPLVQFTKNTPKYLSVPHTKRPQQLTRPLLELLIRRIGNLCCPKTPCATKTEIIMNMDGKIKKKNTIAVYCYEIKCSISVSRYFDGGRSSTRSLPKIAEED